MDGTANQHSRGKVEKGTPQLECQSCRFPVLLSFVVHEGDSRWLDCPYCGRHDEWTVTPRG